MSSTTGFIGLGHMGGAMARRLLAAGHPLVVYDVDTAAREALASRGAQAASSAREVADRAGVVFLCLPSFEAAREVAGQIAGGTALKVVVETSTVGPAAVRSLARRMAPHEVAVIDAPVSGGPRGAEAGTLSLMHAGAPEAIAQALPQLRTIAGRLFDVGAEPGLAQVCKLVNNAISAAGMIAACEATVVGVKAGLDPATLLDAINAGSGRNAGTLDKFPKAILPGTFDYGGPMGLMLKDLSLFIEEAHALGVKSLLAPATLQAWEEAVQRTGGQADYSMVIRHMEIDAGVQVRARPTPKDAQQ
jgi:3-hydroxyisobutyrate dehydrogenase-like beta-hydroxyacid dehydrogenase